MKGEEQLWSILNDKLDNLRASKRLPEAIRVAETALEVAKRAFPDAGSPLATSFEKLGQLLDQKGDRASAKAYLVKAHAILEKVKPPDQRAIYRSARRLPLRRIPQLRLNHSRPHRARARAQAFLPLLKHLLLPKPPRHRRRESYIYGSARLL